MTVPDCQTAGETSTVKPTKKANATAVARISRKQLLVMRASLYGLALRKHLVRVQDPNVDLDQSGGGELAKAAIEMRPSRSGNGVVT
jgi:hypothetical protein